MKSFPLKPLGLSFLILATAAAHSQQAVPKNVQDALRRADQAVKAIIAVPDAKRSFVNTPGALDDLDARLDREVALATFLQYVHPDPKVRAESRAADEAVSNWFIELGKNEALFRALQSYAKRNPPLEGERKRYLEHTLRDYRRSGMALPAGKREELKAVEKELSRLGIEFDKNIAEDQTKVPLLEAELKGVPEDVIKRQLKAVDVYLVGLDGPTISAVMDYADLVETRQKMWLSYRRRAPKNVDVLEQMIKLRAKAANLLGYKNTVDWMIETRMAKNSATVAKFYDELIPLVRRKAEKDMEQFRAKKAEVTGQADAELKPWDYAWTKNVLLRDQYQIDTQKVAEYFPVQSVIDGLFSITQSLYGIEYRDITQDAGKHGFTMWHPDARFYEVVDKAKGAVIGRFFLDLHPRENKYNHAAHWRLHPRKKWADGKVSIPLSVLVCNFTKPTADKPSLLPHDQVETFFHEFGHLLHSMLTETDFARFSGTAVARDFVEAPSQMFENWVWDHAVLSTFAKHYETGEVLPEALLARMKDARTLGSGIETQTQLFLGLMDQAFHTAPGGEVDSTKLAAEVYERTTMFKYVPGTFNQASFGHLNGYHGAYYGYLWSNVFAQDMFGKFEDLGLLSPESGRTYRSKVLGRGGSIDESDMLRDFLGREPNMDAFLKLLGLER